VFISLSSRPGSGASAIKPQRLEAVHTNTSLDYAQRSPESQRVAEARLRTVKTGLPLGWSGRVLRDAIAERPVLLFHLDQADKNVLRTHACPIAQALDDGFVK
jgi:hypothetical protein